MYTARRGLVHRRHVGPRSNGARLLARLGILGALTGCTSLKPRQIPRDRFDYSSALSESWKHQTLLNIVKVSLPTITISAQ